MVKYLVYLVFLATLQSMAQVPDFSRVTKLGNQINSNCEETFPLPSPDGKTLYFVRAACSQNSGGQYTGSDIWVSTYDPVRREWRKPSNVGIGFNDKGHSAIVGTSADGQVLYQLRSSATKKINGIYFSKQSGNSWTRPERVPIAFLNTEKFIGLYLSPDGDVMLISMNDDKSMGLDDIYVSLKKNDGQWSEPHNLGPVINTNGFEISPFLSKDERRIYFASNGHPGLGDADIFYSDRIGESWDEWSKPVNLGNTVNSKGFDAYFSMLDSVAYFSSNREGQFADLYLASLKKPVDSTQLRIQKIVSEAESLLTELGVDEPRPTSSTISTGPTNLTCIEFEANSNELSGLVSAQLIKIADFIETRDYDRITLVAYSGETSSQAAINDELWSRRLATIRDYLQKERLPRLNINFELKKFGTQSSGNCDVEVRYPK